MRSFEDYSSIMFFSSNNDEVFFSFKICFLVFLGNANFLSNLEFSSNANVDTLLVLLGESSAVNPALPKGSRPVLA
jgi:hypothetical protein